MKTIMAVMVMVIGLVTNTNGKQTALPNTAAAANALQGAIEDLTRQIEELRKARAADQQTFSDAAKKLISVEQDGNTTKQDLRIEKTTRESIKEGIELGQSLLTNTLAITLTIAGIFIGIAGIGVSLLGRQRLKLVKEEFEGVEEHLKETRKKFERVEENLKGANVVTRALLSLRPGTPRSEMQEIRNELESYLTSHPTERAAIILARLCRADKDFGRAIAILDRFLKAKADLQQFDKDYAEALYNRACYKLKLWESDPQDVKYKNQAYEDLEKSIQISPANKVDAQSDGDCFKALWQEDRFKALI